MPYTIPPEAYYNAPPRLWITADVSIQKLFLLENGIPIWNANMSSSSRGTGEEQGSYKTPLGWHHISEKFGENAPWGAIFKGRSFTGEVWNPSDSSNDKDLILSRILRLAGDEPHNKTSHERYIYIHGTNHENRIGYPASYGCLRLANDTAIELFNLVSVGMPVFIHES